MTMFALQSAGGTAQKFCWTICKISSSCLISQQCFNHNMSDLYRPCKITPEKHRPTKDEQNVVVKDKKRAVMSKNQKLMMEKGLIQPSSAFGTYHFLPIALKSLEKLIRILDKFMKEINCQKLKMPILTSSNLSKMKEETQEEDGSELMKLKDRHSHELLLSSANEAAICDLISTQPVAFHSLPLRLYQITKKFRDEKRTRTGLIRTREFITKDLYTFDPDERSARLTYEAVNNLYSELFDFIGVKWVKAIGSTGNIGGNLSHEFHLLSEMGRDVLFICDDCTTASNQGIFANENNAQEGSNSVSSTDKEIPKGTPCPYCGGRNLSKSNAIEVAHSFLLGTKYTKPYKTTFISPGGKPELLHMGSYGIGVSRLLGSIVEVLSTTDDIQWPLPIAPFHISVIPPKEGTTEASSAKSFVDKLCKSLDEIFPDEVLVDDRTDLNIGDRLKDLKGLGIPHAIIIGKHIRDDTPKIEFINLYNNETKLLEKSEVLGYLNQLKEEWNSICDMGES